MWINATEEREQNQPLAYTAISSVAKGTNAYTGGKIIFLTNGAKETGYSQVKY